MPIMHTCNRKPIPILTYHQIADAPPKGTPHRSLVVAPKDFSAQMAMLSLLGYRGLSMTDLQPYLRGERVGKVVGITLDDGYLNNLTHAAPVLKHYGFSATCYVVSQLVGKSNVWDRESGIPESSLMNAAQLKQWIAQGQEVGAHSRHHVHLPQLEVDNARDEITNCKTELEVLVNGPVTHFCYPYGEYAPDHVAMAKEAGYTTGTTTQRSRCQSGEDWMQLPRVPVAGRTTRLAFWLKIATGYEDRRRV